VMLLTDDTQEVVGGVGGKNSIPSWVWWIRDYTTTITHTSYCHLPTITLLSSDRGRGGPVVLSNHVIRGEEGMKTTTNSSRGATTVHQPSRQHKTTRGVVNTGN